MTIDPLITTKITTTILITVKMLLTIDDSFAPKAKATETKLKLVRLKRL